MPPPLLFLNLQPYSCFHTLILKFNLTILRNVFSSPQGCLFRLNTLDALQFTGNVVFIAMDTQNPHVTSGESSSAPLSPTTLSLHLTPLINNVIWRFWVSIDMRTTFFVHWSVSRVSNPSKQPHGWPWLEVCSWYVYLSILV